MRTHLSDETLADLLEGAAGSAAEGHLRDCAECRERMEEARAGLALARQAEVPEPSPLYWEALHRQIGRRLDEGRRPWRPAIWTALAALAAGLVFVSLPRSPLHAPPPPARALPAWSPLPAADDDAGMAVLQALAADLEPEAECAGLEECMEEVSDEEGGALAEMLRREGVSS